MPGSGTSSGDHGAVWCVRNQGIPALIRRNLSCWSGRASCVLPPAVTGPSQLVWNRCCVPLILRSCGESSGDCGGFCRFCTQGYPVLVLTGRDLCPIASLIKDNIQVWLAYRSEIQTIIIQEGVWQCPGRHGTAELRVLHLPLKAASRILTFRQLGLWY